MASPSSPLTPQKMFSCENRVALVTGGATGIGRASAEALGAAGASVAIVGLDSPETAAAQLAELGIHAVGITADLADDNQLRAAITSVAETLGPIDTVVAVAGVSRDGALSDDPDGVVRELDEMYALNVRSVVELAELTLPGMAAAGGGSFTVMSSLAGLRGNQILSGYGVTKAANAQIVRNLAVRWGAENIRANAISPGVIATEFARPITADATLASARRAKTPLGRFGTPAEVAGAVVWLASPAGAFVSGQNIVIDGGTLVND